MAISKEDALKRVQNQLARPQADFEQKVDAAIVQQLSWGHKAITVDARNIPRPILEAAISHYEKAGWSARIVDDQRDGNYLELS